MSHVFVCKWTKVDHQWQLWVKGNRKLSGSGDSFESASQQLEKAIWENAKDLDSVIPTVMEFDPPLPIQERLKKFFTPPLYRVFGDGIFDLLIRATLLGDMDTATKEYLNSLYEKGICRACKHGLGKRTEVRLRAEEFDNYDGLFLRSSYVRSDAYFFSDRFISLLTDDELGRLKFRECQLQRKVKRRYFELAGYAIVHNVGVKGFDVRGCECSQCGSRDFNISEPDLDETVKDFICRSDLPNPVPSCFAIEINGGIELCMTEERFNQIRGNKNTKGIMIQRIGIIDDELCDRHPRLQRGTGECFTCSHWVASKQQSFWELPAKGLDLSLNPALVWLKNEMINPQVITIVRQEDSVEHMVEMVEKGEKVNESKTISFRCPECWRLGQLFITHNEFGIAWR